MADERDDDVGAVARGWFPLRDRHETGPSRSLRQEQARDSGKWLQLRARRIEELLAVEVIVCHASGESLPRCDRLVLGRVRAKPVRDSMSKFGFRRVSADADHDTARFSAAASHGEHHFGVAGTTVGGRRTDDLERRVLLLSHFARNPTDVFECESHGLAVQQTAFLRGRASTRRER